MKVLFFPLFITTPHYETELELILTHILKGDEVFCIKCDGYLKTCLNNFYAKKSYCEICRSVVNTGLNTIGFPRKNLLKLPIKHELLEPIPPIFKNLQELIHYTYDGMNLGRVTAANLTITLNWEHRLDTIANKEHVSRILTNTITIYSGMLEILKKISPDLVYIFNGRFGQPGAVIFACEKLGINYITHERAGVLEKYWLREGNIPHDIDAAVKEINELWDNSVEEKEKIGDEFFLERRGGVMQGWYSYVKDQKKGLLPEGFDETKKNIAIFNGNIEETLTIKDQENPLQYPSENEAIEDVIKNLQSEPDMRLYLRVHPHLKGRDNSQIREIKEMGKTYKNLTVIPPESTIHSYDLMDHCNKVVVFGSTIGVEASFWNKPVILNGRAFYEGLGCVYVPNSREELIEMIKTDLPPKSREGALKYGYWDKRKGIAYRFYKPLGVAKGTFLGRTIGPQKIALLKYYLRLFLLENKSINDILLRVRKIENKIKEIVEFVRKRIFR